MQAQLHKGEAAKALGVILRGIELFGKDQTFLPCQERGCVIIENRKGTFVAPKYKTLEGLRAHLESYYGLSSSSIPLPDIRPNYPLRVPHSGASTEDRSNVPKNRSVSPHAVELIQKALGSVENPTLEQISRIARSVNMSEAQVYNFVNRNRPKKRRYSTSDILRPNGRFHFPGTSFGSSNSSDEESDGGVKSEGSAEVDDDSATTRAKEETKREVEAMLAAVYQHGHDELYAPVEQNCVSILAKLREASDEDCEMTERSNKRSRVTRREQDILERGYIQCNGSPDVELLDRIANSLSWDVGRVKRWFHTQRQRKDRRVEDEEPRGGSDHRRAQESAPDWWIDQSTRQQQQLYAARMHQMQHQQHQQQQQQHLQHVGFVPTLQQPQQALPPFPQFALAHTMPQFNAPFPPPPPLSGGKEMFV